VLRENALFVSTRSVSRLPAPGLIFTEHRHLSIGTKPTDMKPFDILVAGTSARATLEKALHKLS
jgi:hypothetical protein